MGNLNKLIDGITGAGDQEKEQKERLEFLKTCAVAKISGYKDELNESFLNPDSVQRTQIPGQRSIRYFEQYHVASSTELNAQIKDHIQKAVKAFFSIPDGNAKDKIQEGVGALIEGALDGFIGSTSVGESEERIYVIVPENNAFIRADIVCWRYNFDQTKFLEKHDTALAYVLCKSVVDHTKLSIDELIYLTTDALSKRERLTLNTKQENAKLAGQSERAINVLEERDRTGKDKKAVGNNAVTKAQQDGNKKTLESADYTYEFSTLDSPAVDTSVWTVDVKPDKALEAELAKLADDIGAHGTTSAPIEIVEAYLEELIKIWKKLTEARKTE